MRDITASPPPQSTGRFEQLPRIHFDRDFTAERLAAIVGGAALMAFAARDRSWRAVGAAVAGVPLIYRGATGAWPVPQAVASRATLSPLHVETSVTIDKPAQELYDFWRRLENLPRFMRHLDEVRDLGDGRSHWVGRTPFGTRAEWEAEIVEERAGPPAVLALGRGLAGRDRRLGAVRGGDGRPRHRGAGRDGHPRPSPPAGPGGRQASPTSSARSTRICGASRTSWKRAKCPPPTASRTASGRGSTPRTPSDPEV